MFESTVKLADSFLEMGVPGYDLVIYKDGECVLRHMGGYADLENKIPVKGNEKYDIYSCSKPITCTAALQLWEKGLFSLEDKLSSYLPEFAEMTVKTENGIQKAQNPILIRHLFEMTAGFSYNLNSSALLACREETNHSCPTRQTMVWLAKEPLEFEPGDQWRYSLCHDVLAALVEVISGQRFEDYVKEHIFDPLGMDDTTFLPSQTVLDSLACKYRFNDDLGKPVRHTAPNVYRLGSKYASGGAGCVSTVDDYIKFLEALRVGDRILKKETVKLMATDRLTEHQKRTYTVKEERGYGLGVRTPKEGIAHTEFGWGGAAGAYLAVDIPNGVTIFYMQHLLNAPNQGLRDQLYDLVFAELLGGETAPRKAEIPDGYNYTY